MMPSKARAQARHSKECQMQPDKLKGLALDRFAHMRKRCAGGLRSAETEPIRGQAFLLRGEL